MVEDSVCEVKDIVMTTEIETFVDTIEKSIFTKGDFLPGMSKFQIEQFVLNEIDFPGVDAKIGQCIRELFSRVQSLVEQEKELEDSKAEVELAIIRRKKFEKKVVENLELDELSTEEYQIYAQKERNREEFFRKRVYFVRKLLEDIYRQACIFWEVYSILLPKRHFDTIEHSEEFNWKLRTIQRILSSKMDELPPWDAKEMDVLLNVANAIHSKKVTLDEVKERMFPDHHGQFSTYGLCKDNSTSSERKGRKTLNK